MSKYNLEYLKSAHKHSSLHKPEIERSSICGCFYCLRTFAPNDIIEWVDNSMPNGPTAVCPKCGIDSVIGSESGYPVNEREFLKAMNQFWF